MYTVEDGHGNVSIGHFEAMTVPSFEPGTRISDLQFVIDRVMVKSEPNQVNLNVLSGGS